jgi:transposase
MGKVYVVDLSEDERARLLALVKKGKVSARKVTRAHILLMAAEGAVDRAICGALHVSTTTVERIRKRFVEGGLDWALEERRRPGAKRKLDDKQEAYLIALACSKPPDGQRRWTLRLLADRMVKLEIVDEVSHETVRQTLKRGISNPGSTRSGSSRPSVASSSPAWRTSSTSTPSRKTQSGRWSASMSVPIKW